MRVAVPTCRGRVSPVFDVARRYRVADVHSGKITDQAEHMVCGEPCAELMGFAIDHVICAGVSRELKYRLERRGILVLAGYCGAVDEVMGAYCSGRLDCGDFDMPGSTRRHRGVPPSEQEGTRTATAAQSRSIID